MRKVILSTLLIFGFIVGTQAQDIHLPKPSPTTTVHQSFSTSFIEYNYSRPSKNGRKIFGHVVHYDELWRTGANAATTITFGERVYINKRRVRAGRYALYTIPGKETWTIILNKGVRNWGTGGYKRSKDVLRFKVPVKHVETTQETFRISVENMELNSCDIVLAWDDVEIVLHVVAKNNKRILKYLEKQLQGENPPYAAAAGYYLRTNQNLDEAIKYYQLAIKKRPKAYYLNWHLAEVYQKLGKKEEAIEQAKIASEKAKSSAFASEYEQHYKDMVESFEK